MTAPRTRSRSALIVFAVCAVAIAAFGLSATPAVAATKSAILVKDINPSGSAGGLGEIVEVGGIAYFAANHGVHGRELWRSDGTAAGTTLVKDIKLGAASANPNELTVVNGVLFFTADDGTNGREVWKSDGTLAGTTLVKDIQPPATGLGPSFLTAVGGRLFLRLTMERLDTNCGQAMGPPGAPCWSRTSIQERLLAYPRR